MLQNKVFTLRPEMYFKLRQSLRSKIKSSYLFWLVNHGVPSSGKHKEEETGRNAGHGLRGQHTFCGR